MRDQWRVKSLLNLALLCWLTWGRHLYFRWWCSQWNWASRTRTSHISTCSVETNH
jgi:hypothetical protein